MWTSSFLAQEKHNTKLEHLSSLAFQSDSSVSNHIIVSNFISVIFLVYMSRYLDLEF